MNQQALIKKIYQCVDAKNATALSHFLTDDIAFQLGNAVPINGKVDVVAANQAFFSSIDQMSHHIDGIWREGNHLICNGTVSYVRLDASEFSAPFATVLTLRENLIEKYQVYVDISEL
jgi:ketosteroid isomerase-like protein